MIPATVALDEASVAELLSSVAGEVITPDAGSYHDARAVWNGRIDRFPGLVSRKECARMSYSINLDRLAGLKAEYDPENLLHSTLNVLPAC